GASRGIRVRDSRQANRPGRLLELPVVGRVAAGSPILAEEHLQGRYQVDPNLFTPRADYLLRVRGMSMRDAGILEGDLLAVHRTQDARSGQIVVARLADEVTVKRLRRRGHAVQLRQGRIIELVLFWGGLLLLVSALHAALYFAYRRSADKLAQGEQWLRWLGIGAFAAGVTWGFGASVFFPSHADERQVFLAFL